MSSIFDKEITMKVKGYAVDQNVASKIKNKVYVEVPAEWENRTIVCILAGSSLQRIQ